MKDKRTLYQFDINQSFVDVCGSYIDFPVGSEIYRVAVVENTARIPDEFLQTEGDKKIYITYADGTIKDSIIKVVGRPMPPDYIYTPTERETFDSLVEKVNATLEDLEVRAARGDFNGKDGADGKDGKDGTNGADGKDGVDGRDGIDGKDGTNGADGAKGDKGDKGDKGERGEKGEKGDKGDTYDDSELRAELAKKQDKLIAGSGIVIASDGKTISATGGGGGGSSVAIADNPSGGVDLTVDGTTKTLADEETARQLNKHLMHLEMYE